MVCQAGKKTGRYLFFVQDDGIGFTPEKENMGVGIPSMRDRVSMLGGTFDLYSTEGKGTQIVMEVPIDE